jgi:hypothetical protein
VIAELAKLAFEPSPANVAAEWAAVVVALLFSIVMATAAEAIAFAVSALTLGATLIGIRMAILYVVLGRPTLYERKGSGFVDFDLLEQEVLNRDGDAGQAHDDFFSEIRRRYGGS